MHGTFTHRAFPPGPIGANLTEDTMFALRNELYPGQTVSYQGRAFALLVIQGGFAFLAGLASPVAAGKLVQVG